MDCSKNTMRTEVLYARPARGLEDTTRCSLGRLVSRYLVYLDFPDSDASVAARVFCFDSCCNLIQLPTPTATAPTACAAPDARMAPPAPLAMAGIAGMLPTVIRMALKVVITLGCSVVSRSSAE